MKAVYLHDDPAVASCSAARRLPKPRPWVLALLLVLSVTALYAPFLHNPLAFDDDMVLGSHVLGVFRHWSALLYLRGLPYASFAYSPAWHGQQLPVWRAGNLLLHALNGVLLMLFLRRLFLRVLPGVGRAEMTVLAFWGGIAFALHPVAVYGAGYLNQRSILMATAFCLLTWWSWLEGLITGKRAWLYAACAFYLLAVQSKEHAVMAAALVVPLFILCHRPADHSQQPQQLRGFLLPMLLFLMIGCLIVWEVEVRKHLIGQAYEPRGAMLLTEEASRHFGFNPKHAYGLSILTQATLYFKYLLLWLLPVPSWMSVDMYEPFDTRLLAAPYVIGLLGYLAWGLAAVWLLFQRGRKGLLGFALLCPWLLYMTEFAAVRISESFVLYRSYLWMPGLLAALPVLVGRLPRRWLSVGILATALALLPLSLLRLQTFTDPLLLWDDAAHVAQNQWGLPGMERVYVNRGNAWGDIGERRRAQKDYEQALKINPNSSAARFNLGLMLYDKGAWAAAVDQFSQVLAASPSVAKVYFFRGMSFSQLNQSTWAIRDFNRTIALDPRNAKAYLARGQALVQQGHNAQALQDVRHAMALSPGLKAARLLQARLAKKPGNVQ